jgi:hypothetical protein
MLFGWLTLVSTGHLRCKQEQRELCTEHHFASSFLGLKANKALEENLKSMVLRVGS